MNLEYQQDLRRVLLQERIRFLKGLPADGELLKPEAADFLVKLVMTYLFGVARGGALMVVTMGKKLTNSATIEEGEHMRLWLDSEEGQNFILHIATEPV